MRITQYFQANRRFQIPQSRDLGLSTGLLLAPEERDGSAWRAIRRYGNLGFEMVISVLIGAGGGRAIDQWLGFTPWFFIIGFIFGVAAGFLNLYRLVTSEKQHLSSGKRPGGGGRD